MADTTPGLDAWTKLQVAAPHPASGAGCASTPGTMLAMRAFGTGRHVTAETPLDGAIPVDTHRSMRELSPTKIQASIDRALRIPRRTPRDRRTP